MRAKNFLDLPYHYQGFKKSHVVIIPFPYEASTTYGQGTKKGPQAIITASAQVELFDEELKIEPYKIGIHTLPALKFSPSGRNFYFPLKTKISQLRALNKFPIILGGEHTVSLGGVLGLVPTKPVSVLYLDAHADLRNNYQGNKFSHACTARRLLEVPWVKNIVQVGTRSISNDPQEGAEFDFYQKNKKRIKIFWARDQARWHIKEIIASLARDVYLSIDVDVFDPSLMPSTGTPEPGGLDWYEVLGLVREVTRARNIVGADLVELCSVSGLAAPDFLAAKLVYKIIGYKFSKP